MTEQAAEGRQEARRARFAAWMAEMRRMLTEVGVEEDEAP